VIEVGDVVRENWSGFSGTVERRDGNDIYVRYPSGKVLKSQLTWLVLIKKGA
jgi:hypothetical protein